MEKSGIFITTTFFSSHEYEVLRESYLNQSMSWAIGISQCPSSVACRCFCNVTSTICFNWLLLYNLSNFNQTSSSCSFLLVCSVWLWYFLVMSLTFRSFQLYCNQIHCRSIILCKLLMLGVNPWNYFTIMIAVVYLFKVALCRICAVNGIRSTSRCAFQRCCRIFAYHLHASLLPSY